MSAVITINQGLDLPMLGEPGTEIRPVSPGKTLSVYPSEFKKVKFKCLVEPGDKVAKGDPLARRKDLTEFFVCAPVAGIVKDVVLGERRSLKEMILEPDGSDKEKTFNTFTVDGVLRAKAENVAAEWLASGLWGLIRQRPFNRIADPAVKPKSIFVNAMASAPFRPAADILVQGKVDAFQLGLNALTLFTDGPVHVNIPASMQGASNAITDAAHVKVIAFSGPHPSGNTSTHIHYLDPIVPGDTVWTLRAGDVVRLGELLLTGQFPSTQRVLLAGEGVKESERGYYDVPPGLPLKELLDTRLEEGDQRVIRGDVLAGEEVDPEDSGITYYDESFVVLPEDRERHLLGWYAPTKEQFSAHRVVPSAWIKNKRFHFGTSTRGSKRAMVLTGIYDKYTPLDLMVDPLSRACIAGEYEDAIAMGILETDPEDFALCSFICPSKTDFGSIISNALAEIEKEGF